MSDLSIRAIRRVHIFIPSKESQEVRCPDCNARLFDRVESLVGCVEKICKCKDYEGNGKSWLLIFHQDITEYMDAVKFESRKIDISDGC